MPAQSEGHRVHHWTTILLAQVAAAALSYAADPVQQPRGDAHVLGEARPGSIAAGLAQTITVLEPPGKDLRPRPVRAGRRHAAFHARRLNPLTSRIAGNAIARR